MARASGWTYPDSRVGSARAPTWSDALFGASWTVTLTLALVIDHFAMPMPDDERARLLAYDNYLMPDQAAGAELQAGNADVRRRA